MISVRPSSLRRHLLVSLLGALLSIPTTTAVAGVRLGDAAPDFTLPDGAAHPITLESFRGRVFVMDFTASWCVACRTALPTLATLTARYAERGVVLITVVIDASRANADRFLAEVMPHHAMTVLYDPTARLLARFGAAGMPALYVIDGGGIVRFIDSGYDADRLTAVGTVLDALLPNTTTPMLEPSPIPRPLPPPLGDDR